VSPQSAAVCKNGHLASTSIVNSDERLELTERARGSMAWSPGMPAFGIGGTAEVDRFCAKCGTLVLTTCSNPDCRAPLPIPNIPGGQRGSSPFCTRCGEPHPWATREQRIGRLIDLLDSEESLGEAERLHVVEAIAVLGEPEDKGSSEDDRVRAGERFRSMAPKAWRVAVPVLTALLTSELRVRLGLPAG
jgi:hypothetical protein